MPLDMPPPGAVLDQYGNPAHRARQTGKARPKATWGAGWDAGQIGRRLSALPTTARAINTLIRSYGKAVLGRSRYLCANNAYAHSARESYVSAMAGSGILPAPQLEDPKLKAIVNQVWADWGGEADADWVTDFYGLQSIIAGEIFEAGEIFVRFRPRRPEDGLVVPLQLQVLPSEMLDTNWNLALENGGRIECGIEFDAIGRRRAYHFWRVFPGTDQYFGQGANLRTIVPAEEVLHVYRPARAGQLRGIPHTLSMIPTLALLDLYDDAELERKRVAALFGAFVTRPDRNPEDHPLGPIDNFTTPLGDIQPSPALEPGVTVDLAPGEDIKFAEPADVGGTYEPFQYRNLLRAAAGAGIPYSDMTGDLRRTSFGSIRAGLIAHRRRIETLQQSVIIYQFCQRVYNRWWTEAVLAGALPVTPAQYAADQRLYRRADWIPPRWDWIDPLKDIEAEQLLVQNHFKSKSEVIKGLGGDPLMVAMEIAQDAQLDEKLGIPSANPPPVPAGQSGPSASAAPRELAPAPAPGLQAPLPLPPAVLTQPTAAASQPPAPPDDAPRVIRTQRDAEGNLIATIEYKSRPARTIRTQRDEEGNLVAIVEEDAASG